MLKILTSFCLLFLVTLSAAEEKSYVFEAKGKFAEELKSLVEKYSKDGKVNVKVYENKDDVVSEERTITQKIVSSFVRDDKDMFKYANVVKGEKMYQKDCASCHWKKAETSRYASARVLSSLTPSEIFKQLKGYKLNYDGKFGGSLRTIMKPQADGLTETEMQSIAVYIYSIKNGGKLPVSKNSFAKDSLEEDSAKSSYLQ